MELDELLVKAFGPLYERTLPTLQPFYQSPTIGLWLVRAAQWLTQWKASSQRQQLAERERTIAKQLSFSE